MADLWHQLASLIVAMPAVVWWLTAGGVLIMATSLLGAILFRRRRPAGRTRRLDPLLVLVAALIATGVSAQGMWIVAGHALHMSGPLRIALFAFAEVALLAEATRARRHFTEHATIGRHGVAVWVIAAGAGVVSAVAADTVDGVLVRLVAPLLAAWLWQGGLEDATAARVADRITSRVSVRRVLVWLRLAEPGDRTVSEAAADRSLARLARTAYRLHTLRSAKASGWRVWWAAGRLRRQVEHANARLGLASDSAVREVLRMHLAVLYQADAGTAPGAVADLAPWRPEGTDDAAARELCAIVRGQARQVRTTLVGSVPLALVPGRVPVNGRRIAPELPHRTSVATSVRAATGTSTGTSNRSSGGSSAGTSRVAATGSSGRKSTRKKPPPRRPAAETRRLAEELMARRPKLKQDEVAAELGISGRQLRNVLGRPA